MVSRSRDEKDGFSLVLDHHHSVFFHRTICCSSSGLACVSAHLGDPNRSRACPITSESVPGADVRTHTAAPTLYVNTRPSSPSRSALPFCPAKRPAEETLPSHPSWGFLSRQPCHQVRDMKGDDGCWTEERKEKRSAPAVGEGRGGTDGPRREGPED